MKEFETGVFSTKSQGVKFMDCYLKKVNITKLNIVIDYFFKVAIVRKSYQGGRSLEVVFLK